MESSEFKIDEYAPSKEPFYLEIAGEKQIFMAAYEAGIPLMIKGPTGCGKSRLVERMSFEINQKLKKSEGTDFHSLPLVTVPCHEDLTADDLKGRYLLTGEYQEGPALIAARRGGILYLDEIVEARPDTIVVMHPLADHRRSLVIEKLGKIVTAPDTFMLVISYNPGYQRKIKELKQSTRQRFAAIEMTYPPSKAEEEIVTHEAGVDLPTARCLVEIAGKVRNLKGSALDEGASTRLLINTGKLIKKGIAPFRACEVGILNPITDQADAYAKEMKALEDIVVNYFPR